MPDAPRRIDVHFVPSHRSPSGLGEPPVPPAAAALANALYAATGYRWRRQPFDVTPEPGRRQMPTSYEPYAPRPVESHGRMRHSGHELKLYSVRYGDAPIELGAFREGIQMALSRLPEARPEAGRPGLGFVIVHRGRSTDYVVLAWWDRENELPVRVFVLEDDAWRPAGESESFCVWDLEIMYHERDAYLETVLVEEPGGSEAYLRRVL